MSLPTVALPAEVVTLSDGQTLEVHSLTFAEAYEWDDRPTPRARLAYLIAKATGVSEDEADAWMGATPTHDIAAVSEAAARVSKLGAAEGEGSRGRSSAASKTHSRSSSPNASG